MGLKIVFIGTSSQYSFVHLDALGKENDIEAVVCAAPRGYKGKDKASDWRNPLYRYARKHNTAFYYTGSISSEFMEREIRKTGCDLICVASCTQLLKKNIIDIPKKGVINAHPAKLPYYKGPNPYYWIFYNQEKESACTIHYINEGEDTGDILNQEIFEISFGMTKAEYDAKINSLSPRLMVKTVYNIENGKAAPICQPEIKTFRARNLKPEDEKYNWEDWEAKRAFHFLRGTDLLDYRYRMTPFKITIEGYGEIYESEKNAIRCSDGGVFYRKHWSLKRLLRIIILRK